jgi:hypothetical protein
MALMAGPPTWRAWNRVAHSLSILPRPPPPLLSFLSLLTLPNRALDSALYLTVAGWLRGEQRAKKAVTNTPADPALRHST